MEDPRLSSVPSEFKALCAQRLLDDAKACSVVWARVKGYPYWPVRSGRGALQAAQARRAGGKNPSRSLRLVPPGAQAQVLSEAAASKKLGKAQQRRKALGVPVMFFGTLEIAMISSHDIVSFQDGVLKGFLSKGKHKSFLKACSQVRTHARGRTRRGHGHGLGVASALWRKTACPRRSPARPRRTRTGTAAAGQRRQRRRQQRCAGGRLVAGPLGENVVGAGTLGAPVPAPQSRVPGLATPPARRVATVPRPAHAPRLACGLLGPGVAPSMRCSASCCPGCPRRSCTLLPRVLPCPGGRVPRA